MYKFSAIILHSEVDDFNDGCQPDTSKTQFLEETYTNESLKGLLADLKKEFKVKEGDFIFNSCDEVGRLDIQFLATERGMKQTSDSNVELWKQGRMKLWLKTVSGKVTKTEVVDFKDFI